MVPILSAPSRPPVEPGPNLVAEGIPPLPAEEADEIRRYSDIREGTFTNWHPTRREMLVLTRFGETYQVHEVKRPGGARRQLTFSQDSILGNVRYDPISGSFFVFPLDTAGNEATQIHRYDFATGETTLLTDGTSRNTTILFSRAGNVLAYRSTRRNGRDFDLYILDPSRPGDAGANRLVAELSGGGFQPRDWSFDDREILLEETVSASRSALWIVNVATGGKRLVTPAGENAQYTNGRFARDGRTLFVLSDKGSPYRRLARVELSTGALTPLTADIPWDVEEFDVSPDGTQLVFPVNEGGFSSLRLLDTGTLRERPAPKLPKGVIQAARSHRSGREIAFMLSASRRVTDVYSWDVKKGTVERWTDSEAGGLNVELFPEAEPIQWPGAGGLAITGFLYRPPSSFPGRRPVLIDIHGGPEAQFRPGFLGPDAYVVRRLGIARLHPNIRGSTGFGREFQTLDDGPRREDALGDLIALLDWIAKDPLLDKERVFVTGGSYGGLMALALATRVPERVRCVESVVGPTSLVTFLENTAGYRRDLRRVEYGDERDPALRQFLLAFSPLTNSARLKIPLFLAHGENDPRVPAGEARQLIAAVRGNGAPVWSLMAKDEGHGFTKASNARYLLQATVAFLREYLLK